MCFKLNQYVDLPGRNEIPMPRIEALPIHTKGKKWYQRMKMWLTVRREFKIIEDYYIFVPYINAWVLIPANFIFDGASIPKILHGIFNPVGILFIQSLLHDCLYRFGNLVIIKNEERQIHEYLCRKGTFVTRKFSDVLFLKQGEFVNGTAILNKIAYRVLRVCGGVSFKPREIRNVDWDEPVHATKR